MLLITQLKELKWKQNMISKLLVAMIFLGVCVTTVGCSTVKIVPTEDKCQIVYVNTKDTTETLRQNYKNNLVLSGKKPVR